MKIHELNNLLREAERVYSIAAASLSSPLIKEALAALNQSIQAAISITTPSFSEGNMSAQYDNLKSYEIFKTGISVKDLPIKQKRREVFDANRTKADCEKAYVYDYWKFAYYPQINKAEIITWKPDAMKKHFSKLKDSDAPEPEEQQPENDENENDENGLENEIFEGDEGDF